MTRDTFNTASQLTTQPANTALGTTAATVAYDTLGERTTSTPSTGPATTNSYDEAQNLTQVTRVAGSKPAINETNTYNGDRLLQTTTNADATSQLAWDTAAGLPLLLTDNAASIIYGPSGLPIEQISSAGTATYLHHDQQGSSRVSTSGTGATLSTATYDPYGNLRSSTGTQPLLGYDGQLRDPNTALIYLRARWYDPTTGQFLTQDPLAAITRAPYAYATNSPLNATDPTGLDVLGIGGFVSGLVGDIPVPDYITFTGAAFIPVIGPLGIGGGLSVTVTRGGKVYIAPQGGIGLAGASGAVRAGYIDQSRPTSYCQIDSFVNGLSVTGEVFAPGLGDAGPSVAETYGNVGQGGLESSSTEVGLGVGSPSGGVVVSHAFPLN